ncbi:lipoyl(octanoyl) transferase LipB [Segetibacter aerophilus]|uniref:Octanoyltransferase n=1 Tax=Segetibacter aerophilus TaxID=670293 RepID=A0A512BFX9_9BACT|nr:lipoyl(octanoyl) transferase LipB [Segetibacter aerophilus]GEO10862.1 octanoyltransferase [Segetibacter aerophilus]
MKQLVLFTDLGKDQPYKETWDLQEQYLQQNSSIKAAARGLPGHQETSHSTTRSTTNHLLFVEHSPVYTLGKSGDIANVLISEEDRQNKGIDFFKINRGGDITFHGPGQLVGYPIMDLEKFKTDLGWYLRSLEEVIILTIAEYGLKGERSKGETGVWLDPDIGGRERKICAMGIRCSRWITMHGFAFNINTDLDYFNYIVPCGIQNKQVTSLQKELGYELPMEEVKEKVKTNFEKIFDVEIQPAASESLAL